MSVITQLERLAGVDVLPDNILAEVAINIDDIDRQMTLQPALYAEWALRAAEAQSQSEQAKTALETVEAKLDEEVRQLAAAEGVRITEAQIDAAIKRKDGYQVALKAYHEARNEFLILSRMEAIMKMRADMLIQIGATQRQLYKTA